MASDNEASCIADPNFAVICAFLQKFGTSCGLNSIDFIDLQKMIENTQEVPEPLANLHIKLLRRIKKAVPLERWERVLSKVCHTYNNQDGWEIERFGYKKARVSCKLRTLKTLLEMQFDYYTKFKNEINKLSADELRSQPLGRDKLGHAYWYQIDGDCQIRVYKEDPDEETWMLVAKDRDGLISLISQLKENDSITTGVEPIINEDSNSLEIEKPILDTGQAEITTSQSAPIDSKSDENEENNESKQITVIESDKVATTNGRTECIEPTKDEPPKQICLRLKPMSELLNSPSAAQYKAEEDAKRKRNHEELLETITPNKARKLTLMNSKPIKAANNKKHIEEFSEEEEDDFDEDEDMEEDSDEVGEEIEEPIMYIKGRGSGKDNCIGNIRQRSEETSPIIGEEISDVLFVFGEGEGAECETGNENQNQTNDKPQGEQSKKSTIKLGMVVDSRSDKVPESVCKSPSKKNRWDVGKPNEETIDTPKVSMFFFGPNTNTTAGISFFGSTSSSSKVGDIQANTDVNVDESTLEDTPQSDNSNEDNLRLINYKEILPEQNHKNAEIPSSMINESVDTEDTSKEVYGIPIITSTTENNVSVNLSKHVSKYNHRNKLENLGYQSSEREVETTSSSTNVIVEDLLKDDDEKCDVISSSIENPDTVKLAKGVDNKIIPEIENYIESKEEMNVASDNNGKINDAVKTETLVLKSYTEKDAICSSTCDISKEGTIEKITPLIINLNSCSTSTSSNTVDNDLIRKNDNMVIKEITKVDICINKELNTGVTNVENTKESTIDSNTVITEMEIEEAIDVTDSNIENRSAESMEIEEIEKLESDVNKSGDRMDIEESDKSDSSELNLGKLIEEAKRTHSFIDTSLPKKDKILETSASIEALPTDLSTVDDSKISMDIEENSVSTITTRNTTSESSIISEVTGKMSKEAEISESNTKDLVESRKVECIEKNMDCGRKIDTTKDRNFPIEEIKFSDSTDRKSIVGNLAVNTTKGNHNAFEDIKIHSTKQSANKKSATLSKLHQEAIEQVTSNKNITIIEGLISSNISEQSTNKLISVESCIVPLSETDLKNVEPAAIIVSTTTDITGNLSLAKEPECIKKIIVPLSKTEKAALDISLTSGEFLIESETESDIKRIEQPVITVSAIADTTNTIATKESLCSKKNIIPLADADVATLDKPLDNKKTTSPSMQSIESLESIDADCHASSIDRDSEVDTAEDPFDNVGIPQDDPLGLAEEEEEEEEAEAEEDEIDEAGEEEMEEEEEEEEGGEIDPEGLEDEEVEREDDELGEEEIEEEEMEIEEEEISNPVNKVAKNITKSTKTVDKIVPGKKNTLSSFSMDFNDSSDSLNLPPMIKEKLKKCQMMQLKKPTGTDDSNNEDEELSEEEVDEEEEEDDDNSSEDSDEEEEEVPVKPMPKGKTDNLKQILPAMKGNINVPAISKGQRSLPVQVMKSTTADLRKERKKKKSEIEILKEETSMKEAPILGVRQSRRIALIKIREEAEKRKLEELTLAQVKFESRKMFETAEKIKKIKLSSDEDYVADLDDLRKKKKKKNHKHPKFDEYNPWKSSSGSSSSQEEEQEEEMAEDSDHQELKSDHEFSPESDLEDDAEVKPLKRARTVRKEDKTDEDDEEADDTPCDKCGKFDHPEWILLCDGCDHGWHCSCLRPALLVIPEGDWFCPPCQHVALLKKLEEQLVDLDKKRSKQLIEVRRKQRLAYVGISLNNVLATKDNKDKKDEKDCDSSGSSSSTSGTTDTSDSDEPIYQLRQRRQTHSYRFNDYDDLINSAIQDEEDPEDEADASAPVGNQGKGKDIATIVNAEKEQREKEAGITVTTTDNGPAKKIVKRKKKRKLNSLVVSSGEDGTSDEDFHGSTTEEEEDDLEFNEPLSSNSSDDSALVGRKRRKGCGVMRRSTRARRSRMDTDFINDDSDISDLPEEIKKRKRRRWTDDSDDLDEEDELSDLSDRSWSKKRKSSKRSSSKSRTKKSKTKTKKRGSESDEPVKKKKRKIKYGGLNDTDEEQEKKPSKQDSCRRTRGKKITYVDALGSDSEDEIRRRKAGIIEESEEEYLAEDDDGLEDEDGNEIEKDSDDSGGTVPARVHIKPITKKGKGKGGIKRIKRAQGIEDELFPPLKMDDPNETIKPDTVTSTTEIKTTTTKDNNEPTSMKVFIDKPPEPEAVDPMQEINRNIESMDEKLMMEDPDYATKQLQMVATQLERKKKEDALSAAEAAAASEDMAKHRRGRKPKVIPYMSPAPQILQAKLQKDDAQLENSNSPEPPPTLPAFGELGTTPPDNGSPMRKRRGRGKGKKTLEKEAAAAAALAVAATALGKEDLGAPPNQDNVLPMSKAGAVRTGRTASPNNNSAAMTSAKLAIATPPQPFSQTEPAPSVITRMLQSPQTGPGSGTPPGGSSPVGTIPTGVPYGPGPGPPPHKYYSPGLPLTLIEGRPPPPGLRGGPHLPPGISPHAIGGLPSSPYGPAPPPPMAGSINHRSYQHGGPPGPPPGSALPLHMMRPPTASHSPPMSSGALYHHHHTVDASPSGGSAIQPMGGGSPGRIPPPGGPHHPRATVPSSGIVIPPSPLVPPHLSSVPPDRRSPLGNTPPPALILPPGIGGGPRYPPHSSPVHQPPPRHHLHMVPPQHAMQLAIHGMAPRPPGSGPLLPGAYLPGPPPPGSYYSTYSPQQPSGIPPEDYHHHQQPPLPPPHGYGMPSAATQQQPPSGPHRSGDSIPPGPTSSVMEGGVGLKSTHSHHGPGTDDGVQEDVGGGSSAAGAEGQDSTGEFGGLVSYFSSQREDDLDG